MKYVYKPITLAVRLALLLALSVALHSCSKDANPYASVASGKEYFPLQISGVTTPNGIGVQTRAGDIALAAGSIGLFRQEDAAGGYQPLSNVEFTYATPFWETDEQILLGSVPAVLAAYYPYAKATTNPFLLTSGKYSDEVGNTCYVNLEANKNSAFLTLELQRLYARLVFTFKGDSYEGDGYVTAIRLAGSGITPVATLDLLDRTAFTDPANKGVYNVRKPVMDFEEIEIKGLTTQFTSGTPAEADCLLVPTVLNGDIGITITVDGSVLSGKISAEALCGAAKALKEGVRYNVTLTVKPVKLEVTSISIMDWETVDIGKGEID